MFFSAGNVAGQLLVCVLHPRVQVFKPRGGNGGKEAGKPGAVPRRPSPSLPAPSVCCLLLFDMRRVRCLLVSFRLSPGSALKFQPSCSLSDKSLLTNDMSGICMKSVREKKKVLAGAKSAEYPSLVFVITMRVWSLPGKGRQEGTGKKNEFLSRASTSHSKKSLFVWERSGERWHSLFCFALAYRPYPVVS